jgi:hypothetical protein
MPFQRTAHPMQFNHQKDLRYIIHPYIFLLKPSKDIQNNLFDYSLTMMRVGVTEMICSAENKKAPIFINDTEIF